MKTLRLTDEQAAYIGHALAKEIDYYEGAATTAFTCALVHPTPYKPRAEILLNMAGYLHDMRIGVELRLRLRRPSRTRTARAG